MPIEHLDGAGLAPTHHGFSGPLRPGAPQAPQPPPRRRPPDLGKLMLAGVGLAAALGVALGFLAKPSGLSVAPRPMAMSAVTPTRVDPQVQIMVNPAKPPPAPKAGAPLEVLPPDMAAAAPRVISAPPLPPAPAPAPAPALQEPPATAFDVASAAPTPLRARPSFDCDGALTRAEEMVCGDERLAAQDRRLARAYRRAMASGAPSEDLRAEQGDWDNIREDAAGVSPQALAQVYNQRIHELEDMARSEAREDW